MQCNLYKACNIFLLILDSILDGWSNQVLFSYIHNIYKQLLSNSELDTSKDNLYPKTQQYLQAQIDQHQTYWLNRFSEVDTYINLDGLLSKKARINDLNMSSNRAICIQKWRISD